MNLNAVAIVLDFVKPLLSVRCLGLQRGQLGLDEPRHGNTLGQLLNSQISRLKDKRHFTYFLAISNNLRTWVPPATTTVNQILRDESTYKQGGADG
jgi:hypothetical protein